MKNIGQQSRAIGELTRDENFRRDVIGNADAAGNSSIQLKILCGVKAATVDDDPAAENQLISCAQELSQSVIKTVKAGEAAFLRPK